MIPSPIVCAALPAAVLLLAACGLHRIPPRDAAPAARPPASSMTRAAPAPLAAEDAALLTRARARHQEALAAQPLWPEAEALRARLQAAGRAAELGNAVAVRAHAAEVLRQADAVLESHDLLRAALELQKVQTYTGLSDPQLERLRQAELALAQRDGPRAWALLSALSRELAQATQRYVVAAGDSLWIISGRPEVYGNPWLWPLIWQANPDTLSDPDRLRAGQRLRIRPNPTIEEVVRAIDTARSHRRGAVRIGEVRETAAP